MAKFWHVGADSLNWCGVQHSFCVQTPDNYDEDMVSNNAELMAAAEDAMLEYMDAEEREDDDAMLCTLTVSEWDYDAPESQNWAENFEITE